MNGPTRIIRDRTGDSSPELPQTGYVIQTGPPPQRIGKRFTDNDRGIIGDDVSAYPPDASGLSLIPHQNVIRKSSPASRQGIPSVDDTAYVPAFAVGDPR